MINVPRLSLAVLTVISGSLAWGEASLLMLPTGDHATGVVPTERQLAARAVSEQLYTQLPADVTIHRDLVYSSADETFCRLDLLLPVDRTAPLPVILKFHGGGLSGGDKSWHRDVMIDWVREGFAVVTANYRMSPEFTWPAMLEDADSALRWIGVNAHAHGLDADRIGVTGDSAGATLAMSLGTFDAALFPGGDTARPRISAVVAWYGATTFVPREGVDWKGWGTSPNWAVIPDHPAGNEAIRRLASPIEHLDAHDPPMLLIHGVHDAVVPTSQSVVFAHAAAESNASVELHLLPDMDHSFRPFPLDEPGLPTQPESLMRGSTTTLAFFGRHLLNRDMMEATSP